VDYELHNLRAIAALNQRGGRMLSLVDLLDAGTLNLDMAAEMAYVAAHGGSFLTAAGPGGVGKTTLMGATLAFLPPGTEIVTIEGPETLDRLASRPADRPQCLVVHEIGRGDYYAYLWGAAVARYFDLAMTPGRSLASNLHACTYEEARGQLMGELLGVSDRALGAVDLLAFMDARRGKRRVAAAWETAGNTASYRPADPPAGHRQAWRWLTQEDRFDEVRSTPAAEAIARRRGGIAPARVAGDLRRLRDFLAQAQAERVHRMEDLRGRALAAGLFADGSTSAA